MGPDMSILLLDAVWFALVYDLVRSAIRFVLEIIVLKHTFQKKGGAYLERIVSLIDLPIALVVFFLSTANSTVFHVKVVPEYAILVVIVSLYRSFIKPHTNPNSTL